MTLHLVWFVQRLRDHAYSRFVSSSFRSFGPRTVIRLPFTCTDGSRIQLGSDSMIGPGSWLSTGPNGEIEIGHRFQATGRLTISSTTRVTIGDDVLIAQGVYISDHTHRRDDPSLPIIAQGTTGDAPVLVKRGAWLGQNVVILPGVTIGAGAVVGANSVVSRDVPDGGVAVGSPARIVKTPEVADQGHPGRPS